MNGNSIGPRGLYGKIPGKADFVHRNLPTAFVLPWDEWLRRALSAGRDALTSKWIATYLRSPPWRFVMDAGIAGPTGWLGVLVSSIDEVQRCYPLTLAIALPDDLRVAAIKVNIDRTFEQLETIALRLIEGECGVDDILDELSRIPVDFKTGTKPERTMLRWGDRSAVAIFDTPSPPTIADMIADVVPDARPAGLSCWWHRGWGEHRPASVVAFGLPPAEAFPAFLDGQWDTYGWSPR